MKKIELLSSGKAKSLYTTENSDQLIMEYRDDTSAFDGKKIEKLAGKGTVNNRFNNFIMNFQFIKNFVIRDFSVSLISLLFLIFNTPYLFDINL